jgi:hypothetical protein
MQSERHKQGLVDQVPMWQPPFIMPHTFCSCSSDGKTLRDLWGGQSWPQPPFRRPSRLKAGCGQYCPPHGAL